MDYYKYNVKRHGPYQASGSNAETTKIKRYRGNHLKKLKEKKILGKMRRMKR